MKLLLIFTAILAFSLAEEEANRELDDSEAEASAAIELLKEGADLHTAASSYNTYVPPSQRPPQWGVPNVQPPQNTWVPPQHETVKPIQPINTQVPANVQNDYYEHHHHHHHPVPQWTKPNYPPPTTTTPVSVIKDERYFGANGYYKYEYQIADGTHVGEEGYYTSPKQDDDSLVKRGWYSYVGADGKTYTVTYWADKTGYHAYGDHLPTPPPVPKAIQTALDQEKEAEKNKPLYDYPTPTQTTPAPVHYTTQAPVHYPTQAPVHYPTQAPTYYPTQAPTYYPTQAPAYDSPQQPAYVPPPQQTYQPPHSHPNPQQPNYPPYTPQQTYYPPQPTYYS